VVSTYKGAPDGSEHTVAGLPDAADFCIDTYDSCDLLVFLGSYLSNSVAALDGARDRSKFRRKRFDISISCKYVLK
jgi:hypothetical protein